MCIFAMINLLIYCCVILLASRIELVNTTDNYSYFKKIYIYILILYIYIYITNLMA